MICKVQRVGFTVHNMEAALTFYMQVLPFEQVSDVEVYGEAWEHLTGVFGARLRVVALRLGSEMIELTQYLAPPGGRAIPSDSRSNDLWFQHIAIVVSDMDAAYALLRKHGVQHVSSAPQTLPDTIPAAAGVQAFYFRDPDGHNLELIAFPQGKGDPRWQRKDNLFLGIDHSAVGITSTERSLAFYRDMLGFRVAGESENFGTEQEHLNMVFGAHLCISGLRAPEGMGVEFLHYLSPPGGRSMPADSCSKDLWHWEVTLTSDDLDATADLLRQQGTRGYTVALISSGVVILPDNPFGYRRALLARDPDGHALKIVEIPQENK